MNINEIINYIEEMNEKDRLRLAIRMNETVYTNIDFNKKELFEKFDISLKEIDIEYKTNLNIPKYILMITAWIIELSKDDQNRVGLYLFNRVCN